MSRTIIISLVYPAFDAGPQHRDGFLVFLAKSQFTATLLRDAPRPPRIRPKKLVLAMCYRA